jgi:hypothetical protein
MQAAGSAASVDLTKVKVLLGLPMRDIGEALPPGGNAQWGITGPACFHGAMQEVRYWAAARTKGELRNAMHRLLDESSEGADVKAGGLLGWWTFEEGNPSRFSMDVTEGRFRNKLVGIGTKSTPSLGVLRHGTSSGASLASKSTLTTNSVSTLGMEASGPHDASINGSDDQRHMQRRKKLRRLLRCLRPQMAWYESEAVSGGEPPPTPAWRERAACKVELRRVKLAVRGRKLMEPVPCVLGCGEDVVRKSMRYHVNYECAERLVSCWMCGEGGITYGMHGQGLSDHVIL